MPFCACNDKVGDPRVKILLWGGEKRERHNPVLEGTELTHPDVPWRVGNITGRGGSCLNEVVVGDNELLDGA
eukprot:3439564-Amphidinium_carterae.1